MLLNLNLLDKLIRAIKQLNHHCRIFNSRDVKFQGAIFVFGLDLYALLKWIRNLAIDIDKGSRVYLKAILYTRTPICLYLVIANCIRHRHHAAR